MTYNEFLNRLRDAAEAESEEMFIAEVGYPAEAPEVDDFIKDLHIIYSAAQDNIKEMIKGYKMVNISRSLEIPYRTLQNWVRGECTAPKYIIILIAFALINN